MDGLSPMNILSKLTSPLSVKSAIAECNELEREPFLEKYGFRYSTEYELFFEKRTYDSKAIAAVAFGLQYGVPALTPGTCQGGKARGRAAWALFRLGFRISGMRNDKDWRIDEVEPTIDAYFRMLKIKNPGRPLEIKNELAALHRANTHRTERAFMLKLNNISAALSEMNLPYLNDFSPKYGEHYQDLVAFLLEDRFGRKVDKTLVAALSRQHKKPRKKIDWAQRDAENRELGDAGEQYVLEQEKARLLKLGRPDLSGKVRRISEISDAYGYDIESYNADGTKIQIEVKTTVCGLDTPFFVSQNELNTSVRYKDTYELHRVYDFSENRRIEIRRGSLDDHYQLATSVYRATRKR